MIEPVSVLTLIVALCNLGMIFYNYKRVEELQKRMDRERFCRYPDTNVRDILIDYELEKARKLDKAIHDVEDELERKKDTNRS